MDALHYWNRAAEQLSLETQKEMDYGFDKQIPQETRMELKRFLGWVECCFYMPIPLWVDFRFRHYLLTREKKRVGYRFYWERLREEPEYYTRTENYPVLELPVRREKSTLDEILISFIEGLTLYFAWVQGGQPEAVEADAATAGQLLARYRIWADTGAS